MSNLSYLADEGGHERIVPQCRLGGVEERLWEQVSVDAHEARAPSRAVLREVLRRVGERSAEEKLVSDAWNI